MRETEVDGSGILYCETKSSTYYGHYYYNKQENSHTIIVRV